MTLRAQEQIAFQGVGRRRVTGRINGGRNPTDGGALLWREADKVLDVCGRVAACLTDYRDPSRTEHALDALVRQRVFGLVLAYEDRTYHDVIRSNSMLALACGRSDLTGAKRVRARHRAYALAGSSTLNRLELGCPETARDHRYRQVVADDAKLDAALVDAFLDVHATRREEIVIDLDATDDPVLDKQEGRSITILPALLLSAPLHYLQQPSARRAGPPLENRFGEGCVQGVEAGGRADPGPLAGGADHGSRRFGLLPRPDHDLVRGRARGSAMCSIWRATRDYGGGSQRIWRRPRRHVPRAGRPRAGSGSCATGRWTAGAAGGGW